ncbi:hypothetical protein A6U95_18715 [Serratia sp. 14-2641]|jgi:DNA-binding winged helix-turn-helix (wHTH) protein|nr:hypothetical protein A6U95_18715 [Serratia sp. 14-2641]
MNLHLINTSYFENNLLVLDGNKLRLKKQVREVTLSKNQTKLLIFLINEINDKHSIIEFIWGGVNSKSKENNYNQLVYKTKALLVQNGFPENFIITLPRYGLCLNKAHEQPRTLKFDPVEFIFNDHNACI